MNDKGREAGSREILKFFNSSIPQSLVAIYLVSVNFGCFLLIFMSK